MKQRIMQNRRILLQVAVEGALQGAELSPDPIFSPTNGSSETNTKRNHRQQQQQQQQHNTSPFDSSMALTILVLLTALFFMGFFTIYIRRFSDEDSPDVRRRRNPSRPARASSVLHDNHKVGGVDSSTIKALPLVSYCGVAKQLITDCPICLSEFEEREIVKLIPHCRHVFHAECLDTWLASHVSCPLCRETQFFKVADDDDVDQEVRLDVAEEQDSNGVNEFGRRSTVADCDTWRGGGMRRTCSCTSLGNRLVLQRSMSF